MKSSDHAFFESFTKMIFKFLTQIDYESKSRRTIDAKITMIMLLQVSEFDAKITMIVLLQVSEFDAKITTTVILQVKEYTSLKISVAKHTKES